MSHPPSPPPLPNRIATQPNSANDLDAESRVHDEEETPFQITKNDPDNIKIEFSKTNTSGCIALRAIICRYLDLPSSTTRVPGARVYDILGQLRCLQNALNQYNSGVSTLSHSFTQYWRQYTLNLLSGFGYRSKSELQPLEVAGLAHLIEEMEQLYSPSIQEAKQLIADGLIKFTALGELFRPGSFVKAPIASSHEFAVFRVTDSYYGEYRTPIGMQKRFLVFMEAAVLVGQHFSLATFSEVFLAWNGGKARNLADFSYQPISDEETRYFLKRSESVVKYGLGGPGYWAYGPDSFYMHASPIQQAATSTLSYAAHNAQSPKGGRIMIDVARGAVLGHHPCQGADEITNSIKELSRRYRQWQQSHSQRQNKHLAASASDGLYIWDQVPSDLLITCWPILVGMSFTAKTWGHVLVTGLNSIDFQEHAFEQLVLSPERKRLIQAVVRQGGTMSQINDVIAVKQSGSIFLLHGAPGVGKTLSAEAVAEMLHKPLYYITMGELGVTPDELERRLSDVLGLCAEWNAIAILDEADVFLETRGTSSDLIRNAMVCVMLRILKYHPGILFLTTNRVRSLDPAFESRISVAIRYEDLDAKARAQVWRNQLGKVTGVEVQAIDITELSVKQMNGRQIKNAVRLALSVALDQNSSLTQSLLLETMQVMAIGRQNMVTDDTWDGKTITPNADANN